MDAVIDPVMGITQEDVDRFVETRKLKGVKRDARVCVCGHGANAHFSPTLGGPADIAEYPAGSIHCQAGKTPCDCQQFVYVLRASDIRSFIQKTEGPGKDHALAKGIASTMNRGVKIEWRDDIACFYCGKPPKEVGALIPIAYNERGGEAFRTTTVNRLHCQGCRTAVKLQVAGNG